MAKKKQKESNSTAPDADYVLSLYRLREQEGDEGELRTKIREMRTLAQMKHEISIPEAYRAISKEVRTPFVRDAILRVSAAITRHPPVGHVEPRDIDQEAKRSANTAEEWLHAVFERMNRDLGEDAGYESTRALVRDAESVLKVVHRPDAWANFPERKGTEDAEAFNKRSDAFLRGAHLPFAWRVVDRMSMLFGDGEFGDDWALEYGEYPTPYLGNRYRMAEDKDGRLVDPQYVLGGKPKAEGELSNTAGRSVKIELWEKDWWSVVIDGQMAPGYPKENPYRPWLPYFRARSGGDSSESVLWAMKDLVPALDSMLTMKKTWAYLGAYPNPVIERAANQQDMPLGDLEGTSSEELRWSPGKALDLSKQPGTKMGFLVPPPVGQDIDGMIQILRSLIDIAGIPSVFRGVGGADQAGYAINQLINAATVTYGRLVDALQRQLEQASEFIFWLVAHRIRETVYVLNEFEEEGETRKRWLGLKPSGNFGNHVASVEHLGQVTFQFRPVLPTDEQARAMIAMQLTNAGKPLDSRRHAMEYWLQYENPEKILDEIAVEEALDNNPMLSDLWVGRALEEAGLVPQQENPAAQLVGPNGAPLLPPSPFAPGQSAAGMPAVPGLTQPMLPPVPRPPAIVGGTGGRAAGSFPGQPSGPRMGQ